VTPTEAVTACEFWTTNLAESLAMGSTTSEDIAAAFSCTVSLPREQWTNPDGPRNWNVNVSRWLAHRDENTGERVSVENPLYLEIAAEILRRETKKAA
jgi:hypothetical protein